MANVQHASLTDPELHEPKGVASATSGQVYVANGSGSGTWTEAEDIEATKDTSASGYVYLPGGFIMQWGLQTFTAQTQTQSVTLPITFPTAVRSIQLTLVENVGQADEQIASLSSVTTSGFDIDQQPTGTGSGTDYGNVYWLAIGY